MSDLPVGLSAMLFRAHRFESQPGGKETFVNDKLKVRVGSLVPPSMPRSPNRNRLPR